MADPLSQGQYPPVPDISHLVMEDNEPVDGVFSERQMRLLVDVLYDGWATSRPFVALANVGVFYSLHQPAIVPDVLLSLDVTPHPEPFAAGRSYLLWEYGKPPDVVIEVVSNPVGGEEQKLATYASFGVPFAVVYDPQGHLSNRPLRVWQHCGQEYVEYAQPGRLGQIGLGLTLWQGKFQGQDGTWLRWCDPEGVLLPLGCETAEQERARAEQERARADRLAARLRELGVDEL